MTVPRANLAIALVPGTTVLFSAVAAAVFNAWVRGECDSKFGCVGGIQFAALIGSVGALLAWAGSGAPVVVARRSVALASGFAVVLSIVATSLVLVVAFPAAVRWPYGDLSLLVGWFFFAAVVTWAAIWGASHACT